VCFTLLTHNVQSLLQLGRQTGECTGRSQLFEISVVMALYGIFLVDGFLIGFRPVDEWVSAWKRQVPEFAGTRTQCVSGFGMREQSVKVRPCNFQIGNFLERGCFERGAKDLCL